MIKIVQLSKKSFFNIEPKIVKKNVDLDVIYLVKNVIEKEKIFQMRQGIQEWSATENETWMALDQNCKNFHRINDQYEKSYVRTKAHTFYYNLWLEESDDIRKDFLHIFDFKRKITNFPNLSYLNNTPRDGFVSRIIMHHYPLGGGFMEEHTDPVNDYNPIQTIIQASEKGKDYITGGLYVKDQETNNEIFIDDMFEIGDMIVFNPNISHGVKPIDSHLKTDWKVEKGRYLIIPLSLRSDYMKDIEESPQGISYDNRT